MSAMHDDPSAYQLDSGTAAVVSFNAQGLIPVVVQDATDGTVLMMAWMDEHALAYTLHTRRGTYYSRSRQEYWIKGLTSGHVQHVVALSADCDGDTLLMQVDQTGAACHTGTRSCFDGRALEFHDAKDRA